MQCKIHIESTLARNPSDELNVQLGGIWECTLQKSPKMELNVTTPALIQLIWRNMWECILVRNLINVVIWLLRGETIQVQSEIMTILPLKQRIWMHKKSTQLRFVLHVIIDQNSLSASYMKIYVLNRSFGVLLCIWSFISRNALQDNYNILIVHNFLSVRHYAMIPQAGLWD